MTSKRRAAIVSPLRTPVGKFLGTLAPLGAGELGAVIIKALIERSGIDPVRVDDVVFSQGYGNAEAPAIGQAAAWLRDHDDEAAALGAAGKALADEVTWDRAIARLLS